MKCYCGMHSSLRSDDEDLCCFICGLRAFTGRPKSTCTIFFPGIGRPCWSRPEKMLMHHASASLPGGMASF